MGREVVMGVFWWVVLGWIVWCSCWLGDWFVMN